MEARPLRVGIVTHYWLPHMGGIEVLARDQAQLLADRGWDVTVFTSRMPGDPEVSEEGGIRVRRFRCANVLESRFGVPVPLMSPGMLFALTRSARELDLVIAHGHVYVGSAYAMLATVLNRVPLMVVQHNPFVEYTSRILTRLERLADRTLGKAVLVRAAKVITVSDFTKRFVESIAPRADVIRIHPGVDLTRFSPSDVPGSNGRRLVITVRRLVARNGIDTLIRAWIDNELGQHADLVIVGDGGLRGTLAGMASSDGTIRFAGRLPDNELQALYRAADVFVLPTSSGEGYGLALAEALASGLPAVVTDVGAPSELVLDGVTGIVVPPGDPCALAHAIMRITTDTELLVTLRRNVIAGRDKLSQEAPLLAFREIASGARAG